MIYPWHMGFFIAMRNSSPSPQQNIRENLRNPWITSPSPTRILFSSRPDRLRTAGVSWWFFASTYGWCSPSTNGKSMDCSNKIHQSMANPIWWLLISKSLQWLIQWQISNPMANICLSPIQCLDCSDFRFAMDWIWIGLWCEQILAINGWTAAAKAPFLSATKWTWTTWGPVLSCFAITCTMVFFVCHLSLSTESIHIYSLFFYNLSSIYHKS